MHRLLAHAEDLHTENSSEVFHFITSPIPALIFFFAVWGGAVLLLRRYATVSPAKLILLSLLWCLVVGVGLFSIAPVVSIVAISLGVVIALGLSLALLA